MSIFNKKLFFGWENIKWFIKEIIKIYSIEPSYFSKKRIESGFGFIVAEWGMITYLISKLSTMDIYAFAIWASIQFFVAGYIIKQIEKNKLIPTQTKEENQETVDSDK